MTSFSARRAASRKYSISVLVIRYATTEKRGASIFPWKNYAKEKSWLICSRSHLRVDQRLSSFPNRIIVLWLLLQNQHRLTEWEFSRRFYISTELLFLFVLRSVKLIMKLRWKELAFVGRSFRYSVKYRENGVPEETAREFVDRYFIKWDYLQLKPNLRDSESSL